MQWNRPIALAVSILLGAGSWGATASAQGANPAAPPPAATAAPQSTTSPSASPWINLYFNTGSSAIRPEDVAKLDHASRAYDEGKPIVMIVAGSTDQTGSPEANLKLSQVRADNVVQQLVARGIPAQRLQILAKGVSDPAVPDSADKNQPHDRRVQISWR